MLEHFYIFISFMRGGTYHIERNPLICRADFYMIGTSVMKELNINTSQTSMEQNLNLIRAPLILGTTEESILEVIWQFARVSLLSVFTPAGNYMFKVNDRNTKTRCEICSKLTIKIPERRHWRRSVIFIINFEYISHLVLVFLLLTLSR